VALLLEYGNGGGFWNCLSFAVEFFFWKERIGLF
jgi:hypothetical protein